MSYSSKTAKIVTGLNCNVFNSRKIDKSTHAQNRLKLKFASVIGSPTYSFRADFF